MRLKQVAFVFAAFIVTLIAGGISIALFENETGSISKHFEAKNAQLFETYAKFLVPKLSDPRVLDVTGPIKRTGTRSFNFHSGPFASKFTSEIAIEGEKGEFLLTVTAVRNNRDWREISLDIAPPETPFEQEDWETSLTLETIEEFGRPEPPEIPEIEMPDIPDAPDAKAED